MRYRETQQISGIYEFSVMTTILQPRRHGNVYDSGERAIDLSKSSFN